MAERHKHADVIIAWANGQKVQFKNNLGHWVDYPLSIMGTPSFHDPHSNWRIKPRTIKIGDMEVPEPLREMPSDDTTYYYVDTGYQDLYDFESWEGSKSDLHRFNHGFCHLTKDAAISHAKALIAVSGGAV